MVRPFHVCLFGLLAALLGTSVGSARADEQADLILALEQRLQQSEGNKDKIVAVATEAVEKRVDVACLIVVYAGRNLTRVAVETRTPPVTVDLEGKPIKFDQTTDIDGGASQIVAILIASQSARSVFRQEVIKYIGQTERQAKVAELLLRTVSGYSIEALRQRIKEKQSKWPFPLCLPNCDE